MLQQKSTMQWLIINHAMDDYLVRQKPDSYPGTPSQSSRDCLSSENVVSVGCTTGRTDISTFVDQLQSRGCAERGCGGRMMVKKCALTILETMIGECSE
jgi:hypothetical protein